jgi:hypothetical protein
MSIYQEKAKECKCCGKHVPLPVRLKEFNGIKMCPTTFDNIIEYKRVWTEFGKRPPGNIRKHFSDYVQKIVEQSIDNIDAKNI